MLSILDTYRKRIDVTLFPEELMDIQHDAIKDYVFCRITPGDLIVLLKYISYRLDLLNY